jgi:hypothetical protein
VKAKIKLFLTPDIYAVLSISVEIPSGQKAKADIIGISEEEQKNLIGQALNTILALLGNSDEA